MRSYWPVAIVLAVSFGLRCCNLNHTSVKPLDEVFHAIVARSLLSNPLSPTLNRSVLLAVDPADWQNAHIWLHKPPLSLWQIAISFATFGINTFALRFPSALLATASAGLTYLIARRLFDFQVALVALLLQNFNPVLEMLVHGYVFSDHVDISLLFWSELSIYFLLRLAASNDRLDALLCGAAQGAAFLSKTFPALITLLLALLLLGLTRRDPRWRPLKAVNVGWLLFGTLLIAGPWNLYAYLNWPEQYAAQTLGILAHLNQNVEGWAGPWDRLWVDYGWRVFHVFYPALFVAVALATSEMVRRRSGRLAFVLAWLLLVLLPNTIATSKPMTATLVCWPAAWLLLAWLMVEAYRGSTRAIVGLLLTLLAYAFLVRQPLPTEGWGYPASHAFAGVLLENWQPVAAGLGATLVALLIASRRTCPRVGRLAVLFAVIIFFCCPLGWSQPHGYLSDFWRVSRIHRVDPIDDALADFARSLPTQAIVLLDERTSLENKLLQWKADRDCWPMRPETWRDLGRQITDRGGLVYVITPQTLDLPVIRNDLPNGRIAYAFSPQAADVIRMAHPSRYAG